MPSEQTRPDLCQTIAAKKAITVLKTLLDEATTLGREPFGSVRVSEWIDGARSTLAQAGVSESLLRDIDDLQESRGMGMVFYNDSVAEEMRELSNGHIDWMVALMNNTIVQLEQMPEPDKVPKLILTPAPKEHASQSRVLSSTPPQRDASNEGQHRSNSEIIEDLLRAKPMDVAVRLGEELKQTESQNRAEMKRQDQIHVFLSYARPDFDVVARLFDQLSADGFVPWMDVRCIHPGEKWDLAIKHGIKQADFFLLCLSPQSSNRRGVLQKEIRMAMDRLTELLDEDIYFIPARLVECVLPENVAAYQSVDLFKSNGYSLLVKALKEGFLRRQRRSE